MRDCVRARRRLGSCARVGGCHADERVRPPLQTIANVPTEWLTRGRSVARARRRVRAACDSPAARGVSSAGGAGRLAANCQDARRDSLLPIMEHARSMGGRRPMKGVNRHGCAPRGALAARALRYFGVCEDISVLAGHLSANADLCSEQGRVGGCEPRYCIAYLVPSPPLRWRRSLGGLLKSCSFGMTPRYCEDVVPAPPLRWRGSLRTTN